MFNNGLLFPPYHQHVFRSKCDPRCYNTVQRIFQGFTVDFSPTAVSDIFQILKWVFVLFYRTVRLWDSIHAKRQSARRTGQPVQEKDDPDSC